MSEDLSKSPNFVGKHYQLEVKYRVQPPRERVQGGRPPFDHSPGSAL